ncbi:MAG: hypothetical protein LBI20_02325 [Holosporales bacterium]|jgi:hypothetical protein|nr:hypothetical protein [Holosporales bacterium]
MRNIFVLLIMVLVCGCFSSLAQPNVDEYVDTAIENLKLAQKKLAKEDPESKPSKSVRKKDANLDAIVELQEKLPDSVDATQFLMAIMTQMIFLEFVHNLIGPIPNDESDLQKEALEGGEKCRSVTENLQKEYQNIVALLMAANLIIKLTDSLIQKLLDLNPNKPISMQDLQKLFVATSKLADSVCLPDVKDKVNALWILIKKSLDDSMVPTVVVLKVLVTVRELILKDLDTFATAAAAFSRKSENLLKTLLQYSDSINEKIKSPDTPKNVKDWLKFVSTIIKNLIAKLTTNGKQIREGTSATIKMATDFGSTIKEGVKNCRPE